MRDFLLDPLRLLFRRKASSSLLAILTLSLLGCNLTCDPTKRLISDKGKFWWIEYWKDFRGEIKEVKGPYDSKGKQVPVDPNTTLEHIVPLEHPAYKKGADTLPADPYSNPISTPLPSGSPAATDLSPYTTLFGTTADGKFLQLNMDMGTAVRSLDLGDDLRDIDMSPENRFAYLVSYGGLTSPAAYSVKVVDITSFSVAGTIPMPSGVFPLRLDTTPDGKFIYVTGSLISTSDFTPRVIVIDAISRTVIKTMALPGEWIRESAIKISPDGVLAFVTVKNGVAVIHIGTHEFSHVINTQSSGSHLAIDPRGTKLYVAPDYGPFVTNPKPPPQITRLEGVGVYDISTAVQINHFPIDDFHSSLMGMALSVDGTQLAVTHLITDPITLKNGAPILEIIDVNTGQLIHSEPGSNGIVSGLQLIPVAAR